MELFFNSITILERGKGYTFDDVLIVPNSSEISSRRAPDLRAKFTRTHHMNLPIISANMDTITGSDMACSMAKLGGVGILHRFMPVEEQVEEIKKIKKFQEENNIQTPICASIGVKEDGKMRAHKLVEAGVQVLTIDIAHGDSVMMYETLDYVKSNFNHISVVAGNVATPTGVKTLIDHGADAVKVGIGPGSMCTTRIITGCGVPQLTAIALCAQEAKKYEVPVIADGGIKNSGDMIKALAVGASSIMVGSLLSGTLETPGEVQKGMKKYRGMASKDAQVSWRGELPMGMAAEGEHTLVPCKGSVENVINELCGGIRSGMTYVNAHNLREVEEKVRFMEMTPSGLNESRPHGVH